MNNKACTKNDDSICNIFYTKNLFHNNRTDMGSGSWVSNASYSLNFAFYLFKLNAIFNKSQSKHDIQEKST